MTPPPELLVRLPPVRDISLVGWTSQQDPQSADESADQSTDIAADIAAGIAADLFGDAAKAGSGSRQRSTGDGGEEGLAGDAAWLQREKLAKDEALAKCGASRVANTRASKKERAIRRLTLSYY